MAKVFCIGLPFAKVVVESSRKATIVELTEAEWSEVWHDAIPLSLTRCGQRRAQNTDAQDGQSGHSGSGSRGDGGAEDGANAQDGRGAEDEDGANAQDGQGAEDGANAQDGEDGENAQNGQGHDQDDSESEEEPGSEEAHDLEVMLVLRGAQSGAGITQDGILLLARSKGSGLAMSVSLIFRFRVEKGCDWMHTTVVARGGFETQGRVIADDVTRRVGLLHDELFVQFSVEDSQAPATLLETSLCNHMHDTATKSTVSSAQGSDCLMALGLQAGYLRLGTCGAVEGRLEGKSSALLTNAQESSLSFKLPTTLNSTFSLHEVHSKLVGKLAFVACHPWLHVLVCLVTAASAGDCFQEDIVTNTYQVWSVVRCHPDHCSLFGSKSCLLLQR